MGTTIKEFWDLEWVQPLILRKGMGTTKEFLDLEWVQPLILRKGMGTTI